jgi:hypothetical protein
MITTTRNRIHFLSALLGAFVLVWLSPGCKRSGASAPPAATVAASPAPNAGTDSSKLKGRWLRPDGGYNLVIAAVAADGRAEATYFNPNPIRVAWARVKTEGPTIKLDVELRDENYPGCLYKLTFMPETDRLLGTYFQAQAQQTYEVEFVRLP